ncbi:endonuclease [Gracilaria domingensis]|nr:endonuclease [Gracilaria domingensis]
MEIYSSHFGPLLRKELETEQDQLRLLRVANVPGLILQGLRVNRIRRLYSDIVYSLESRTILPHSRFGKGDLIDISYKTETAEAVILSRQPKKLLVTVPVGSEADNRMSTFVATKTLVRAEFGANTLSYERALAAVDLLTNGTTLPSSVARLIIMSLKDEQAQQQPMNMFNSFSAKTPRKRKQLSVEQRLWATQAGEKVSSFHEELANQLVNKMKRVLNKSQIRAIRVALRQKLTLIQGPPGTGKTFTAAHLISCAHQLGHAPILACAGTNVATDNLMRKIVMTCPKARVIRLGRISAMEHDVWERSLDSQLERNRRVRRARLEAERGAQVNLRTIEKEVANEILKQADVIVATCVGCGRDELKGFEFSLVVIDEATQVTEPDSLIPFSCSRNFETQCVLVGDHFQLPPTVLSTNPSAKTAGLEVSLFLRLWACGIHVQLLDTQYRMHPDISRFPSSHFYSGSLHNGIRSADRPAPAILYKTASFLLAQGRSVFCNIDSGTEESVSSSLRLEKENTGTSFMNKAEAQAVVKIVSLITQRNETEKEGQWNVSEEFEIGIISPYEGQVRLLHDLLATNGDSKMKISTVDGFQGQEKDVIIVSTVRSNQKGNTGFLKDWRRLNVSITRARVFLIVVGNENTLCHDPHWRAWIKSHPKTDILELMNG